MTTATQSGFWSWLAGPQAQATTGPERKPRPGPIFIHDAVLPWNGTTMLCEILKEDAERDGDDSA